MISLIIFNNLLVTYFFLSRIL